MKLLRSLLSISLMLTLPYGYLIAEEILPNRLQGAIILKVLTFETQIKQQNEISIFVFDAPEIASVLKQFEGRSIANGKLAKVASGDEIPQDHYDVIYIGNPFASEEALAYARKSQALSIYPVSEKMTHKGTLGLGLKSGKPIFLLNLDSSKKEGRHWNPAILKIAKTL